MATDPILLSTSAERSRAQSALEEAISDARSSLLLQRPGAPSWDDPAWNLASLTSRSGPRGGTISIPIGPILPVGRRGEGVFKPYEPYWGDLLKTILVWRLEDMDSKGAVINGYTVREFSKCVRRLIDHIISMNAPNITGVSKKIIEEYFENTSHLPSFHQSKIVIEMMVARAVAPQLSGLSLKAKSQARRGVPSSVQPTTWNEIVALADAFNRLKAGTSPLAYRDDFHYLRYNTMLATLLACAPGRVSELWRLAADTAVITAPVEQLGDQIPTEQGEDLDFKFGLVWHPVKNGRAVIKPIPGAMQPVASKCVEILRSYGEEARATARWIMENPAVIPISKEIADLRTCRETGTITNRQIKRLFGVPEDSDLGKATIWGTYFQRTKKTRRRSGIGATHVNHYSFHELQKEWWELFQVRWKRSFGADWPYSINTETYKLTADNTFLLIYENALLPRAQNRSKIFLGAPSIGSLGWPAP